MKTPIADFVRAYADASPLRLHMPGHKGKALLGPEALDLTEIDGADVLYRARGIIRESEENAAALFGTARSFYSTEGSSLCIRAMLYLARLRALSQGRPPRIAAGRNAHSVFLTAAALLDVDICWLSGEGLLSCAVTPETLEPVLRAQSPAAVYLTSPDYLGNCLDLAPLASLCHRYGALLLVDNAHGAYLRFLPGERHPMELGADLCCDSAHKTLPALTGAAYLHVSKDCPAELRETAEAALRLFASTSPSYLLLQSLDLVNRELAGDFPARLRETVKRLDALKAALSAEGWLLTGDEPLKLTLCPKARGYTGGALAARLAEKGIVCEFADPDFLVLMFSPALEDTDLRRLREALEDLPPRAAIPDVPPPLPRARRRLRPREALLAPRETLPLDACLGRVLADPCVSCPPAVPILVCGEEISREALALFRYYGCTALDVVREGQGDEVSKP